MADCQGNGGLKEADEKIDSLLRLISLQMVDVQMFNCNNSITSNVLNDLKVSICNHPLHFVQLSYHSKELLKSEKLKLDEGRQLDNIRSNLIQVYSVFPRNKERSEYMHQTDLLHLCLFTLSDCYNKVWFNNNISPNKLSIFSMLLLATILVDFKFCFLLISRTQCMVELAEDFGEVELPRQLVFLVRDFIQDQQPYGERPNMFSDLVRN